MTTVTTNYNVELPLETSLNIVKDAIAYLASLDSGYRQQFDGSNKLKQASNLLDDFEDSLPIAQFARLAEQRQDLRKDVNSSKSNTSTFWGSWNPQYRKQAYQFKITSNDFFETVKAALPRQCKAIAHRSHFNPKFPSLLTGDPTPSRCCAVQPLQDVPSIVLQRGATVETTTNVADTSPALEIGQPCPLLLQPPVVDHLQVIPLHPAQPHDHASSQGLLAPINNTGQSVGHTFPLPNRPVSCGPGLPMNIWSIQNLMVDGGVHFQGFLCIGLSDRLR
ncbi:hypothetical protein C8R43DRAFT_952968 [Mycena crocata]|nr:hypothetical protein C8R43DRAFT_952968 [Mycena crocata]